MTEQVQARRIFIASTSELGEERRALREEVGFYNERFGIRHGLIFVTQGSETVSPSVGRPQGRINPALRQSDYMVLMVGQRMGTPTTTSAPYLTGIEEELLEALTCLNQPSEPMRNVLLVFGPIPPDRLIDPGPQLDAALAFRDLVERSKEVLFDRYETVDRLRQLLAQQLHDWAADAGPKVAIASPTLQSRLRARNGTGMAGPSGRTSAELVTQAKHFADSGLTTQAELAFAEAAQSQEPVVLEEWAKFLRRSGQLNRAHDLNKTILGLPEVLADDGPDGWATRSRALANMGLIARKQGDLQRSRADLIEAVKSARHAGNPETLAYSLDLLGLTLTRIGLADEAAACYEEALALRPVASGPTQRAKSLLNLARLDRQRDRQASGLERVEEAISLVEDDRPVDRLTLASALAAEGHLRIQTQPEIARERLNVALSINEDLANADGFCVSSSLLAQLDLAQGAYEKARAHAEAVLEKSRISGNQESRVIGLRLLGRAAGAQGATEDAVSYLLQSLELASSLGDAHQAAASREALEALTA